MPRILVIHFDPAEAANLAARIRREGLEADVYPTRGAAGLRTLDGNRPDAILIDLVRMPSYGRFMGALLRERKSTRTIPLVFLEGDPAKTRQVRQMLPDAAFTNLLRLRESLERAIRAAPTETLLPDVTRIPPAGKLRIVAGAAVALLHAPPGFLAKLAPLPAKVRLQSEIGEAAVVLLFVKSAAQLSRELPRLAPEMRPGRTFWVLWPKKASGVPSDLTAPLIFEMSAAVGLAAHKVCAVDETWSALAVGRRRSRRAAPSGT